MKQKNKSEFPESLYRLLEVYRPVKDYKDATHFFSTQQIADALEEHTGEFISLPKIIAELKKLGYNYGPMGELGLSWLLHRKEVF